MMFRRAVPILLHPTFLDLVVTERVVCLTSYVEIGREVYEREQTLADRKKLPTPAFRFATPFTPGELPPQTAGAYYGRLPSARIDSVLLQGAAIEARLSGRYFRLRSYSLLDLDDPTIGTGEKSGAAVWVCGIDRDGALRPFYNALAYENGSKTHPMRSLRIVGAPPVAFVYQPVSVGFVYGAYALAADEIGGGEYRRNYNNCNCGGFNCYSNCNCNCACDCNCNCNC
jgi:hypothetical protein